MELAGTYLKAIVTDISGQKDGKLHGKKPEMVVYHTDHILFLSIPLRNTDLCRLSFQTLMPLPSGFLGLVQDML